MSTAFATVQGHPLETTEYRLGSLNVSSPDSQPDTIRSAMADDGYVYLPGFFERAQVLDVRHELVTRLSALDFLAPGTNPIDAVAREGCGQPSVFDLYHQLAVGNAPLHALLYGGRMLQFWQDFLGGDVLHFDFTWLRVTPPGGGTAAHTDIVFMGRGTKQLYTAWVPYGDVPLELGGLAVLEHGHRHETIRNDYATHDVDAYCENTGEHPTTGPDPDRSLLDADPAHLRQELGGRWLTTNYAAGDLLLFSMLTPHVGIDNQSTNRLRLSSDSRYQLANEDVDERWMGSEPIGHGPNAKVGLIC